MIRNQWYVVAQSRQLGQKPLALTRLGEALVFYRDNSGQPHCLLDLCCHRGAALSLGRLVPAGISRIWLKGRPKTGELRLQCPFHGLEYQGDGHCTCIPANSKAAAVGSQYRVRSYPVRERDGWIFIWWGRAKSDAVMEAEIDLPPASDPGPQYFDDIPQGLCQSTACHPWAAHYARVIENQLDVVHVPFVHYNTIGRGNRTVVDGPGIQWIGQRLMYTYVFNRLDDGSPARKPDQVPVPPPDRDYKLEFLFPNLWQNRITDKLRLVGAFIPVDDSHTILCLRVYQGFVRLPLLRSLVHRIFHSYNRKVAFQDRRIVQTQRPGISRLKGGERLLQGDLPIVEYRKRRQELLDQAGQD